MNYIGLIGIIATVIWIVITIYSGKKLFFQKNLFNDLKDGDKFFLEEAGDYTIWIKIRKHRLNSLSFESPIILDHRENEIKLRRAVGVTTTSGTISKYPLYNFNVPSGHYEFGIIDKPYYTLDFFTSRVSNPIEKGEYSIRTKAKFTNYIGFILGIIASIGFMLLTILSFVV